MDTLTRQLAAGAPPLVARALPPAIPQGGRRELVAAGVRLDVLHWEQARHARRRAVQPRVELGARGLEGADRVHLLHGDPDVVEAVEQAVLPEGVDVERVLGAALTDDCLRGQVNLNLLEGGGVLEQ
eukprot:CAMPEP_0184379254 /NCGR_PEP_ID=MMETSP0007-20130409/3699_1 /TAXON_ID=97485 /ORGANISM="Prymnesium parvum, Strain Texoma1" /LENGTH=126 /DNA_ID=CAMNT_0026723863 /DNA_START=445 /DNA_END=823 /DNA_ORIENTATION=+